VCVREREGEIGSSRYKFVLSQRGGEISSSSSSSSLIVSARTNYLAQRQSRVVIAVY